MRKGEPRPDASDPMWPQGLRSLLESSKFGLCAAAEGIRLKHRQVQMSSAGARAGQC
jgi:hypothetical protein